MLTSGGHNAGIVSEPGHPHRSYQLLRRAAEGGYATPDEYLARAPHTEGSWWPAFAAWLANHSGPARKPPSLGASGAGYAPLGDAPGTYVLQR